MLSLVQNENLERAQVASLVSALSAGKSARETQAETRALIEAARSINWATVSQHEEAQRLVTRLKGLLSEMTVTRGKASGR